MTTYTLPNSKLDDFCGTQRYLDSIFISAYQWPERKTEMTTVFRSDREIQIPIIIEKSVSQKPESLISLGGILANGFMRAGCDLPGAFLLDMTECTDECTEDNDHFHVVANNFAGWDNDNSDTP